MFTFGRLLSRCSPKFVLGDLLKKLEVYGNLCQVPMFLLLTMVYLVLMVWVQQCQLENQYPPSQRWPVAEDFLGIRS